MMQRSLPLLLPLLPLLCGSHAAPQTQPTPIMPTAPPAGALPLVFTANCADAATFAFRGAALVSVADGSCVTLAAPAPQDWTKVVLAACNASDPLQLWGLWPGSTASRARQTADSGVAVGPGNTGHEGQPPQPLHPRVAAPFQALAYQGQAHGSGTRARAGARAGAQDTPRAVGMGLPLRGACSRTAPVPGRGCQQVCGCAVPTPGRRLWHCCHQ
jgi:hypothetical protein